MNRPGTLHTVRYLLLIAAVGVLVVAGGCTSDGDGAAPATSEPAGAATTIATTTTTTIDVTRACAALGAETVGWLEELIAQLDGLGVAQVVDPALRPEELVALEERGKELDALGDELGCDPGTIQAGVLQEASRMEARGPIGRELLELLARAGGAQG